MTIAESFDVPGATRLRRHEHDCPHICVVLDGGFIEREGKSWRDVGPGTLRVSGAASHDLDFSAGGATCLVLELEGDDLPGVESARFLEDDPRLVMLARSLARSTKSRTADNAVETGNLTTELLAQVDRRLRGRMGPPPSWLEHVREMLHDRAGSCSVSDLAQRVGVHRVHLARTFREHYGVSVSAYVRRRRVHHALQLLASNPLPLAQLALHAGFADQSHLT
ncbi:MAG TPA: helix-turn-helix transcriptional regulator, partial [Gemmatimonadaceae bacterium]|nr:helix-turn-helix transcriptional regulator [Gemmatimonadaceae bacterium]